MDLEMVLNELSLGSPIDNLQTAKQLLSDLVSTVQMVEFRHKVRVTLITQRNLPSLLLSPGYPVARWWGDHSVDERVRRLFITLVTKGPYIDDITETSLEEFLYQKDPARGLGYAFQRDALALSLRSDSRWYPSRIELSFVQLDDNGEIIEEAVEVIHASHNDHVLEHAGWIKSRIASVLRNGSDVWEYRKQLFPNLQFCTSVREQLLVLNSGNSPLRLIEKKLSDLEACCKDWQERGSVFDLRQIPGKCAPESEATLNEYRHQRTFHCPDGVIRVFSLHVRITNDWRLHFFPLESQKQIIIGYIGEHLPTAKFHM